MHPLSTTRPPWRPLLPPSLRKEAIEVVMDLAAALLRRLRAPGRESNAPPDAAARELGLLTGKAGVALFFGYLASCGLHDGAAELAREFLEEAEHGLATQRMGVSFCSGVAGIAWAHAHIRSRFLGGRDPSSLDQVNETLLAYLHQGRWRSGFDLLYGLTGIGIYALETLPRRSARTLARRVLDRLAELAQGGAGLAAWATPVSRSFDAGTFNLGMAHGTPGVMAFLARAVAAGIAPRATLALLDRATRWMRGRKLAASAESAYPVLCDADGAAGDPAREAWCHGDAGLAAALLAVARARGEAALEAEALALAHRSARRPLQQTGVADAGLCHGAAGLAHIFNRLHQTTADAALGEVAITWYRRALAYRRPGGGLGGFTAVWKAGPDAPPVDVADPGVLGGAAGVGLALLAASTSIEPAWDRILLLDL